MRKIHHRDDLRRRFFHLTAINVAANLTVPLAGVVDTAMLGHLPEIRFLAGVALAGVIFDFLYWSFGFLRMGTTGLTAQARGKGDAGEIERTLARSLLLALVAGVLILLLQAPLERLSFALLGGAEDVEAAGGEYYAARIWGAPAVLLNLVFLGWFLGREESRVALLMTAIGNLANIAFNYVFIIRLGMAAEGAGLATMLAQYLTLASALVFYWPRRRAAAWQRHEILDPSRLKALLRLQFDILVRTLCLVSAFAVFTNLSALLGTALLTANTLLLRVLTFAAYLIDGAAYSTEILAGTFHGAGDRAALRRLLHLAVITGLAMAAPFLAVILFSPGALLALLTSHADLVALASSYRGGLAAALLLGAPAYVLDGYFLGLAAGRTLRNAMLVSLCGVFLPLAWLAMQESDNTYLWLAMVAFMAARVATLGWSLWWTQCASSASSRLSGRLSRTSSTPPGKSSSTKTVA